MRNIGMLLPRACGCASFLVAFRLIGCVVVSVAAQWQAALSPSMSALTPGLRPHDEPALFPADADTPLAPRPSSAHASLMRRRRLDWGLTPPVTPNETPTATPTTPVAVLSAPVPVSVAAVDDGVAAAAKAVTPPRSTEQTISPTAQVPPTSTPTLRDLQPLAVYGFPPPEADPSLPTTPLLPAAPYFDTDTQSDPEVVLSAHKDATAEKFSLTDVELGELGSEDVTALESGAGGQVPERRHTRSTARRLWHWYGTYPHTSSRNSKVK
jgi:hypothetical protein